MHGISIVIPALNEAQGIGHVLDDLRQAHAALHVPLEIIVVDDGSTDGTAEAAQRHGAAVIRHPVNMGYGASLKRGIRQARHEWIGMLDADGTYAARDLCGLIAQAEPYDMLVGARTGAIYRGSLVKYPMRLVFRWLCTYVTGARVPDPNSGCRVMRREMVLGYLDMLSQGYSFTTSLTMVCLLEGRLVGFLPIAYTHRIGSSKVRLIRDTLRSSQILLEVVLRYNPLKAYLLFGAVPFAIGWAFVRTPWIWAVMMGFSFLIWSLGGLAVLLSRRNRPAA